MSDLSLDQKSDAWLVAALMSEDADDRDAVAAYIVETHAPQLTAYLRQKLPVAWADDALSETWKGFLTTIERQGVNTSIGQLLGGIAQHKRADAVEKITHERRVEADLPYTLQGGSDVVGEIEAREIESYVKGLPYGESILTPCERILWMLDKQYDYPLELVSRIMDKEPDKLYTHYSNAGKKVWRVIKSEEYQAHDWKDNPFPDNRPTLTDDAVIIENFSSWFLPRLTEEEIAPLGISKQELSEHFSALLMVPRWKADEGSNTEYGGLDLLIVRRDDHKSWEKEIARIRRRPDKRDFLLPYAGLANLDVDNSFLKLTLQTLVQIIPDLDGEVLSDHTFLSMHNVPQVVPVTLGELDPGAYFDPVYFPEDDAYARWPFLDEAKAWM